MRTLFPIAVLFLLAVRHGMAEGDAVDDKCFCQLTGTIDDCCCRVEDAGLLHRDVSPVMARLLQQPFFRFYKVNLSPTCPFWATEGQCRMKQCAVEPCDEADLPAALRHPVKQCDHELSALQHTVSVADQTALDSWEAYDATRDDFCEIEDEDSPQLRFISLPDNPERFTGYIGDSPRRVWAAIYGENCFKPETAQFLTSQVVAKLCMEKRVFFRIISGLHACINLHVAASFPQQVQASPFLPAETIWGPNLTMFERFFEPQYTFGEGPGRLKNVYFTYLLLLRSIIRGAPLWREDVLYTGDAAADTETRQLVQSLLNLTQSYPSTFNESVMFHGPETVQLREEFKRLFRNVSRIMDCVECDKCRAWGKLQVHGLGVAMKILFSNHDLSSQSSAAALRLRRNDVVALFNTFGRFAQALDEIRIFQQLANVAQHAAKNGHGAEKAKKPSSSPFQKP